MKKIDVIKELVIKENSLIEISFIGDLENINDFSGFTFSNDYQPSFTMTDVDNRLIELQNAEPMRVLRLERNRKLAETDWRASSDLTLSSEWSTYRQALRDLPSTATPRLDENENLQNVTWPNEPT